MKNITESSISINSYTNIINFNDLENFQRINISLEDFNLLNKANSKINIIGKYDSIYIFRENTKDIYLGGFLNMPSRSYYKIKSNNDICEINNYYSNRKEKDEYNSRMYFFLDINISYESLIRHFLNNSFNCDIITYYYRTNKKTELDNLTLSDNIYKFMN